MCRSTPVHKRRGHMGNKGTKGVKGRRGSKSNKGPSDDLNDKDDLPAQRRRSKSAPAKRISTTHDRKSSTGSSLSIEALGANAGTVLSDAIRIALQQAYKIDNDNGSARVLEVEAYTCKEQFVDKNMTAAKSDSPLATDYSPLPFINIRNMFGVSKVEYQSSLCDRPLVGSDGGAGASGSVFFLSADNKYIIKSLPKSEADKLREILKPYHQHMLRHKESLLPKFFGLYKLKMGKRWVRVVVMNNAFYTPLEVHQKYDLKGSTVNRHVSEKKQQEAADHGDVAVLKDDDLSKAIWLTQVQRDELLGQTHRDGQFLCTHGIMDYSLLLGGGSSGW